VGFMKPSNKAAKAAQASEDARMAAIKATQSRVNSVFDNPARQAEIQKFISDLRTFKLGDLNDNKAIADRQLTFSLARNGQLGGSTQIDQQRDLGKTYQRGVLDIDRQALGAGAQLSAADQDARARLISLATSGLDATTGASQAAAALRSNIESTRSTAQAQGVDNLFGSVADFAKRSREAADKRRGMLASGFGYYNQGSGYGGGG